MTTYRLPEALGGGEYEGSIEERLAGVIRLNFVGRAIYVPADMLTEIPPPLPEEPCVGPHLIGKTPCVRVSTATGPRWVIGGPVPRTGWFSWRETWELLGGPDVTITPLVPSVPVEPAKHAEAGGYVGPPGQCGITCACGLEFDGFDTVAAAKAFLDRHIAKESGAVEPVELPWADDALELEVHATVGCGCHGQEDGARLVCVGMGSETRYLEPADLRAFIAALSAADRSETP